MKAKYISEALKDVLRPKTPQEIVDVIMEKDTVEERIEDLVGLYRKSPQIFSNLTTLEDVDPEVNQIMMLLNIANEKKKGNEDAAQDILMDIAEKYGRDSILVQAKHLNSLTRGSSYRDERIFSQSDLDKLKLDLYKETRSEEESFRDEYFNSYLFIGYNDMKEVKIDGETYHKKRLGIENLVKVDLYNPQDLTQAYGMKIRATTVDGGKVWAVWIPKDMWEQDYAYNEDIPDDVRKFIDENKFQV